MKDQGRRAGAAAVKALMRATGVGARHIHSLFSIDPLSDESGIVRPSRGNCRSYAGILSLSPLSTACRTSEDWTRAE